ncbi:hypothetical protein [Maribacter antarcticus]|uniref:hypothetical protein n=1 Tax=Maribacter antarcticus TaxID=505250 RepID=UPI00047EE6FE|nr:hypothetical protein [Maribacter antarcticus]
MTYVFVIFVVLGLWHLYYEQVISETIKQGLKYKFYKLRDDLRSENINGIEHKNDKILFNILDDSINSLIYSIDDITITNYMLLKKEYKKDKAYKKVSDYVLNLTEKSKNNRLVNIEREMTELGISALVANHGGLFPYLCIPMFIWYIVSVIKNQVGKLKKEIENISSRMVFNSAQKVRYTPSGRVKVATIIHN